MSPATALLLEREPSPWLRAHENLTRLAKQRAMADAEEGRCLLAALRAAVHVHMGYASFGEYVERLFGYNRRTTQEKIRVAEALETLPNIARALDEGSVSWSAVRELTRVALPGTEGAWLETAHGKTVRQLEELVAGRLPGDTPASPPNPSARRHVLRFEVTPETFALFREAASKLRRRSGSPLSEDSVLLEMARQILAGPQDAGRAAYQIALSVCAECGRGSQQGSGELIPVSADIVEMASCDAQHIGHAHPQPANDAAQPETHAHVGARAKQTIPPRVRRTVLARDQHRCQVPGCANATFVDIHHLEPRAEGGANHPGNLITLCGAHHRAIHDGHLSAEREQNGVRFRHPDGTAYGEPPQPGILERHHELLYALTALGFRQSDAQRALRDLRKDPQLTNASIEQCLRAALQRLT